MDLESIKNHFENVIKKSSFYGTTSTINDMSLLHPVFQYDIEKILLTSPVQIKITETYRSSNRQQILFKEGLTKLKTVGMHHYGLACDFVKVLPGGQLSWKGDWSFLGKLATAQGLVWGGDWNEPTIKHSFQDADHIQFVTLEEQNEIFKLGV